MPNKDKIMNNEERKITNKYNNKSQEFETNINTPFNKEAFTLA